MVNKLGDTFASCCYQSVLTHNYLAGKGKPHFPVPALHYEVDFRHNQVEILWRGYHPDDQDEDKLLWWETVRLFVAGRGEV